MIDITKYDNESEYLLNVSSKSTSISEKRNPRDLPRFGVYW